MRMQGFPFLNRFFGEKGGGKTPEPEKASMGVITTPAAQGHVLREKMMEKKLTHGEIVSASISPVRLVMTEERMALYFCPMKTLEVLETIAPGDGEDIPAHVTVEGLRVPADFEGLYTLKNVRLTSNGTMQIMATDKTTWEKATI